jgi:hypothetical protein
MVNQEYLNKSLLNENHEDSIHSNNLTKEAISIGDKPFALSRWLGGQQGWDLSRPVLFSFYTVALQTTPFIPRKKKIFFEKNISYNLLLKFYKD